MYLDASGSLLSVKWLKISSEARWACVFRPRFFSTVRFARP